MPLTGKYEIPQSVLSRTVGDETILLNLETSTYHSLNGVAGRFWSLILEGKSLGEVETTLLAEYAVDSAQLETDLKELCAELEKLSLLKLVV
ncbi:MAG TPA: PqqD family protein [Acidobacteriaceae bacterium]|nr:PqqD family protein [Acidobacteriaceae bacterium]